MTTKRVQARRAEAAELRKFFGGKWSSKRLVHVCPAGCCGAVAKADREISVRRAVELARLIVTPAMTLPAMNKYTKVDPVVRQVCLLASFRGLLRKVLALKVGKPMPEDSVSDSGVSGDAAVGAPSGRNCPHAEGWSHEIAQGFSLCLQEVDNMETIDLVGNMFTDHVGPLQTLQIWNMEESFASRRPLFHL